jgi:hypothetical protein
MMAIFASPSRRDGERSYASAQLKLASGTAAKGTFKGNASVTPWVIPGGWTVQGVMATDKAGNSTFLGYNELGSGTDASLPLLTAEKFTPTTVDVRNGAKKVSVTASAKDTGSGVARVSVTWTSPSKRNAVTASLTRRSGSALSGGWAGSATVPTCVEPGTWTASAQVVDVAGNVRNYTAAQLGAGWTRNLVVVGTDAIASTVSGPSGDVPANGPIPMTFNEPVKNVTTSSLALRDMATKTPVAGAWACKSAAGAAVGCIADPATTASFTPVAPLTSWGYEVWMNRAGMTGAKLTDLAGNHGQNSCPAYVFVD